MLRFAEAGQLGRIGTISIARSGEKRAGAVKEGTRGAGESHHGEEVTARERFVMFT